MKKYKLKMKWKILIITIIIFLIVLLYGMFIGTSGLIVKEYKVIDKNLPESFYGTKIVHFSDLHYGRTVYEKKLKDIVEKINILKADIVIFTGDLIDRDTKITTNIKNTIISELSKINSTYGNYYVTGNHDKYFKGFDELMEQSNFISLNNNYDTIYNNNDNIFIGGINSEISKKAKISNIEEYLSGENISKYKIFAMHVPDNMKYIKDYNFNLVLAGHSHNGQVRLPFIGAVIKPLGARRYYDEHYKVGNTEFYISSGIGTSTLNIRLFDRPSINFYRLVNR